MTDEEHPQRNLLKSACDYCLACDVHISLRKQGAWETQTKKNIQTKGFIIETLLLRRKVIK